MKFMRTKKTAVIICGITGDLSRTKLVPALEELYSGARLSSVPAIIGTGRKALSGEDLQALFLINNEKFRSLLYYHQGIDGLKRFCENQFQYDNLVIFLSLPPEAYERTAEELYREGFRENVRIIVEKPFGFDLRSSRKLNRTLTQLYKEEQIFRIDHYLAKEAVQNILVFRFTNTLFQPVWNSHYIESIQISALEESGIRERGVYFDKAGIIRDMVQNHLTQLLCLLTMEAPASLSAEDIRAEKMSILKVLKVERSCRWQYENYRKEKGVSSESETETYSEMELSINNFRWSGVPVYLRTGKAVNRTGIEIAIVFKPQPPILYNRDRALEKNRIIFKVQPSAGIIVDIASKVPGGNFQLTNANLAFCYRDISPERIPDAYLKLLMDVIEGDRTLFVSAEETEQAWKVFEDCLGTGVVKSYPAGTLPESCFCCEWIDFSPYMNFCVEREDAL